MEELLKDAGVAVAALFPVIDPIGNTPWFVAATRDLSSRERRSQALWGVLIAIVMLIGFLVAGNLILDFFGVSLAAVEFVGGLVIGWVGWEMLRSAQLSKTGAEDVAPGEVDIAVSPLAFPLLAGPGALAVALGLSNRHDAAVDYAGFALGIVIVLAIAFVILTRAGNIVSRLGPRWIDVINGVMGLIVLAIAAELVFHGISDHFGLAIVD